MTEAMVGAQNDGREDVSDAIADVIDLLVGWCRPGARICAAQVPSRCPHCDASLTGRAQRVLQPTTGMVSWVCPDCEHMAAMTPMPEAPTAPAQPALGQTIGRLVYSGRGTPNPHPVEFNDEAPARPAQPVSPPRPTTNRTLTTLDRIITSWSASSVDGRDDDDWTRAHNETLRNCVAELQALSDAEHAREDAALATFAAELQRMEASGELRAPEDVVDDAAIAEARRRVCEAVRSAYGAAPHQEDTGVREALDALATAEREGGGQASALRGALEASRLYVLERPANEFPGGVERRLDVLEKVDAALALTPSDAARAVRAVADTLAEADAIMTDLLMSNSTVDARRLFFPSLLTLTDLS